MFAKRDEQPFCPPTGQKQEPQLPRPGLGKRLSRKVVPGLPRPATFRRQNSERREKLKPIKPSIAERRAVSAVSVDRRRAVSTRPVSPLNNVQKRSAPEIGEDGFSRITRRETWPEPAGRTSREEPMRSPSPPPPPPSLPLDASTDAKEQEGHPDDEIDEEIREALEKKWILNLSMHFRDQSPREKFFLTYAETPQRWRRVTVSCDYRDAPEDSLERDLQILHFQRDKSARIYESIRSSLADIQFFDTVTNLKLETRDDRLHVHVTEDIHEKIPYPSVHAVEHLKCRRFTESQLNFESHMSGFVYKVTVDNHTWIKKEIPGPDSVDEFLYEINALDELKDAKSVIHFKGLVVDEDHSVVKGLLIGFAEQGALVDILYDYKGTLSWQRREKWARQIVQGLCEIHEAGFVQGDFTLSNIVVNQQDEAKIIDINRRGCPVGWEPPEISKLVECSLRISMYIGVKSDLFQLGMVLWALAKEEDEPERQERPLSPRAFGDDIPQYYREIVTTCLSLKPRNRLSTKELLLRFPLLANDSLYQLNQNPPAPDRCIPSTRHSSASPPNSDCSFHRRQSRDAYADDSRSGSIDIPFDGPGSYMVRRRGRQPANNMSSLSFSEHSRNGSPDNGSDSEAQVVTVSPRNGEHRWEEVMMDGQPYLVDTSSLHLDDNEYAKSGHRSVVGMEEGMQELRRDFTHVDSGLADMDLVGVGGHEILKFDGKDKEILDDARPGSENELVELGNIGHLARGELNSRTPEK
ncbi:hypothetical protein MMC07_004853 [Pseudocyphellaria aurata]|nr:hypothetical protein [Pseudocyphellaria aurata]